MSINSYIKDISSLKELSVAISRFCEESENQLISIDVNLQLRFESLKSKESNLLIIIEGIKEELAIAKEIYTNCLESRYEDDDDEYIIYPDCDCELEEVRSCKRRLELAENNYFLFRKEISSLEKAIERFQTLKIKYNSIFLREREVAISALNQLINGAEDYLSVSNPINNTNLNGLSLIDDIIDLDPTLIISTTLAIAEIIILSVFHFVGLTGSLISVFNSKNDRLITTTYIENDINHICSEIIIENIGSLNYGKILSINIPKCLQEEQIGKYLIQNMESICRANDCKEIYGWANERNVQFYKNRGYNTRKEIKGAGSEIFKELGGNYFELQQNAKNIFAEFNNNLLPTNSLGIIQVNPMNVVLPVEINEENFWQQHGLDQIKFIELIEKFEKCKNELSNGKTLEEIRIEDPKATNAYDVFYGLEPIRLLKSGNFYKLDGNGRHRIAAAHLYFLQTGIIVELPAMVYEIL